MKQRCLNPKCADYRYYGARGIEVCDRWLAFENFLADMGDRPDGRTLGRIDNNSDYGPSNCGWFTIVEQNRNRRSTTRWLSYAGETLTLSEWAERLGMKTRTLYDRVAVWGWEPARALTTEVAHKQGLTHPC